MNRGWTAHYKGPSFARTYYYRALGESKVADDLSLLLTELTTAHQVLERVGFTHEGTNRESAFAGGEYVDDEQYGLLETEWRARTP